MEHPVEPQTLTHDEARYALHAATDGLLTPADQQALGQHLASCEACRAYAAELGQFETGLRAALQERWPSPSAEAVQQGSGKVFTALERLNPQRTSRMKHFMSGSARTLGWATLAILFIVALGWGIRALLPGPLPAAPATPTTAPIIQASQSTTPTAPAEEAVNGNSPAPTATLAETAAPTPILNLPASSTGAFPNVAFSFTIPYPTTPDSVNIYRHQLGEAITSENARQVAAQFGLQGGVYAMPSEASWLNIFEATDGFRLLRFLSFPGQFVYENRSGHFYSFSEPLPYEEQVRIATEFLNQYGLLDLPYRAGPSPVQPSTVVFTPLLDERPVIYGIGKDPGNMAWMSVSIDKGQVSRAMISRQSFNAVGQFPILTAEQAWARLGDQDALQHARYAVLEADRPITYRQWSRTYSAGEQVDLYGTVQVRQPTTPGDPTLITLNEYLVANGEGLSVIDPWTSVHGWGQFNPNEDGNLVFNLEGWEISTQESEYLTGTIQRQGDQAFLAAGDGRTLALPDLPAEVPAGVTVELTGYILPGDPATMNWGYISTGEYITAYYMSMSCGGWGGGGGGSENANFGGGMLSVPNVDPSIPPTPTPAPALGPYAVDERLDGLTGTVQVTIHRYLDGSTSLELGLYAESTDKASGGVFFFLEGEALTGMEQYHNLPIRVWGSVTSLKNDTPILNVERYELLDPDLRIQEWTGTEQIVTLEDREVVLLTTSEGQSFVLSSSLIWDAAASLIGMPGDLIEIEGYVIPGQQFGGYPVIKELSGGTPPDGVITSNQPNEYDHASDLGAFPAGALSGQVTIDSIELAYASTTLQHCTAGQDTDPSTAAYLVVQPIWVFTGHFEDGRIFTVQVQALPNEYIP